MTGALVLAVAAVCGLIFVLLAEEWMSVTLLSNSMPLVFYSAESRYHIVDILLRRGWHQTSHPGKADLVILRHLSQLRRLQKVVDPYRQSISKLPGTQRLADKGDLYTLLKQHVDPVTLRRMIPETYRMYDARDHGCFWVTQNACTNRDTIWIRKERDQAQGIGITIGRARDLFPNQTVGSNHIVQRYVLNPLLLNGKKMEIRWFWVIVSVSPPIAFYQPGFVRLTSVNYTADDWANPLKHVTNVFQQRVRTNRGNIVLGNDLKWDLQQLQGYLSRHKLTATDDWVATVLDAEIHGYLAEIFRAALAARVFDPRPGFFEVLALDVLLTDKLHPFMLEVQGKPGFSHSHPSKAQVIPDLLQGAVKLALDIHNRKKSIVLCRYCNRCCYYYFYYYYYYWVADSNLPDGINALRRIEL